MEKLKKEQKTLTMRGHKDIRAFGQPAPSH
jgi:hypothetical protein